jgi:hypothetical protein
LYLILFFSSYLIPIKKISVQIRKMAFMLAPAGELVLDGLEGGSIVQGAETVATQFKNEILKGGTFGLAEGALFGAGEKLYERVKEDLGFSNNQIKKGRHKKRCSM